MAVGFDICNKCLFIRDSFSVVALLHTIDRLRGAAESWKSAVAIEFQEEIAPFVVGWPAGIRELTPVNNLEYNN